MDSQSILSCVKGGEEAKSEFLGAGPYSMQSTSRFTHIYLFNPPYGLETGTTMPILQMRKVRLREVSINNLPKFTKVVKGKPVF